MFNWLKYNIIRILLTVLISGVVVAGIVLIVSLAYMNHDDDISSKMDKITNNFQVKEINPYEPFATLVGTDIKIYLSSEQIYKIYHTPSCNYIRVVYNKTPLRYHIYDAQLLCNKSS